MTLELYCLAAYLAGRRDELVRMEAMLLEPDRELEQRAPVPAQASVNAVEEVSVPHSCQRVPAVVVGGR